MKSREFFALSLLCLLPFLASMGCTPRAPAGDSLPVPIDAPSASQPGSADALADFTVEPADVHMCDGQDRVVATVRWQVKDPAVATVKIEVDGDAKSERKLFAAGGATGEEKTGDWVVAGLRFHLLDAASGKELASHVVKGLPCN